MPKTVSEQQATSIAQIRQRAHGARRRRVESSVQRTASTAKALGLESEAIAPAQHVDSGVQEQASTETAANATTGRGLLASHVAESTAAATATTADAIIADAQPSCADCSQSRAKYDSTLSRGLNDPEQSKHSAAATQPWQFAIQLGHNVTENLHAPPAGRGEPVQPRSHAFARCGRARERQDDFAAAQDSGWHSR